MNSLAQAVALQSGMMLLFLLKGVSDAPAQSSRRRLDPEREPTVMVQADIGVPELYGIALGIVTERRWAFSVIADGVLLRGSGFDPAQGLGIQIGKSLKTGDILDVISAPNSLVAQWAYLFKTPKDEGDGMVARLYVGYWNTERVGLNIHTYIGASMIAARAYRPMYGPCLKFGLNYNFAT